MAAGTGALLGFLGIYVVLGRVVFLSAALSQAASLGVVLSHLLVISLGLGATWVSPSVGALALTLAAAALLTTDRSALATRRDGLLDLVFLVGAAGTLAAGTRIVTEVQDVTSIVFGSAVAVLPGDLTLLVGVAAGLLALHLWRGRGFAGALADPEGARVRGLPVGLLRLLLLASLAAAVSTGTRVLGALPVFAFSVLPALAALRVASNVPRARAGGVHRRAQRLRELRRGLPLGPAGGDSAGAEGRGLRGAGGGVSGDRGGAGEAQACAASCP